MDNSCLCWGAGLDGEEVVVWASGVSELGELGLTSVSISSFIMSGLLTPSLRSETSSSPLGLGTVWKTDERFIN